MNKSAGDAMMFSMSQAGLVFDIVGAISVAWSFFSAQYDALVRAVNERTLSETVDIEGMAAARNDALFGIPVLVAGFLIQLVAPLVDSELCQLQIAVGTTAVLGLGAVTYSLGRRMWIDCAVRRIREQTANRKVVIDGGTY